jgi:predicted DCC family thiol-disulfide oxidoreductase YuxK
MRGPSPPAKPVIIYDGDCRFCGLWVSWWRQRAPAETEFIPFQDRSVAARFPNVPAQALSAAVHLIDTDGSVYAGAEAVFRALAAVPRYARWLHWYRRSRLFASISECLYRFVAQHRRGFLILTRIFRQNGSSPYF